MLGGDASGGGLAGSLLTRAVEVWGTECVQAEERAERALMGRVGGYASGNAFAGQRRGKGKSNRVHAQEELEDHLKVKLGLDGEAERMLGRVFRRELDRERAHAAAGAGAGNLNMNANANTNAAAGMKRRDPFLDA
jgi:hypothetical protein